MITQTIDPHNSVQKTRRVRSQVATVLTKWGLLPRFKRWRLTQDPDTGMVVLFGILNNKYIATHTSIPFSDYFDPRLLHDLANELQVQVVSCNGDGLRYAFVDDGKLLVRVVYDKVIQSSPVPPVEVAAIDDHARVHEGVGAFLKIFDDIKLRDDVASPPPAKALPEIVVINEEEFNKRVAEHEVDHQRIKRLRKLLDDAAG